MEKMDKETMTNISFQLILHAGNARSLCMESISLAKTGKYSEAQEKLREAEVELETAHGTQTNLIFTNSSGETEGIIPDILMTHAQDHFISAMICMDMGREMVSILEEVNTLKELVKEN